MKKIQSCVTLVIPQIPSLQEQGDESEWVFLSKESSARYQLQNNGFQFIYLPFNFPPEIPYSCMYMECPDLYAQNRITVIFSQCASDSGWDWGTEILVMTLMAMPAWLGVQSVQLHVFSRTCMIISAALLVMTGSMVQGLFSGQPAVFFVFKSKYNPLGCFGPTCVIFYNKNKYLSVWFNPCAGLNKMTADKAPLEGATASEVFFKIKLLFFWIIWS